MNIDKVLLVNSKVEIAILNDQLEENQTMSRSLIQEVYDDSFSIMVPINNGHALYLATGDAVTVAILIDNTRYAFKSEVLNKKKEANIMLVVLKKPDQMTASERRDLVRIKTLLPIKYKIIENANRSNWENIEPVKGAYITDLSGNGLSLSLEWPLAKDALIVLGIHLEIKNINMQAKLLGEVVRCEKIDSHYRIGIKFEIVTDRQQGQIINYVCHSLRRLIQIGRDDF
jgi:c-di-GMP-binding flagellar brake protein YcgR